MRDKIPSFICIFGITLRGSHRSKFRNLGMNVFIYPYPSMWAWLLGNHHAIIRSLRVLVLIIRASQLAVAGNMD